MSFSKAFKAMQLFKPFDATTIYRGCNEHVLYVQHALLPFASGNSNSNSNNNNNAAEEGELNEVWYCMLTTERLIICKRGADGKIVDRKQLSYEHIIQFKLKKNKRFKKSNLPAIKVYVSYTVGNNNGVDGGVVEIDDGKLSAPNTPSIKPSDDDKYPKVIFSFHDAEARDTMHMKMMEIIGKNKHQKAGSRTPSFSKSDNDEDSKDSGDLDAGSRSHSHCSNGNMHMHINCDLYETLAVILERQHTYNECVDMCGAVRAGGGASSDAQDGCLQQLFRFLEPAQTQAQQMTDIAHQKYVYKLSRADVKRVEAYYRSKADNAQIRRHRQQWFISTYVAAKLFSPYFPITGVNDELKWLWMQQLCRTSVHFIGDTAMNNRCIKLMDILMRKCFHCKYVKVLDTFFHEKDYQNLQILLYFLNNFVNLKTTHLEALPKFRFKQMMPLLVANRKRDESYTQLFIQLVHIAALRAQFKEADIYQCMMQYIACAELEHAVLMEDEIVNALIKMLQSVDKKLHKIWPENALYLQEIIQSESDENLALCKIRISLRLNPKLLHQTYPGLYDDLNALQCAEKKHVWPALVQFLKDKVEGFADGHVCQTSFDLQPQQQQRDDDECLLSDSERRHEEGDSILFSSLLMSALQDTDKAVGDRVDVTRNQMHRCPAGAGAAASPVKTAPVTTTAAKSPYRKFVSPSMTSTQVVNAFRSPSKTALAKKNRKHDGLSSSQWGFSNFVGQCFSFAHINQDAQLQATTTRNGGGGAGSHQVTPVGNGNDLQRRLQSYVTTLDKFKNKTRSLEQKISDLHQVLDTQNEKIVELKLENKMIKNVYLNNEVSNVQNGGASEYDEQMVNMKLVKNKQWKQWTHLEVVHWICALNNGQFAKYKQTLTVNMKLRNIAGKHFARIDKSDLTYFYGIVNFDDVCDLYQHIQQLLANSYAE
eukprot:CAMPEP_0202691952 /NCGR_PEP_ID=MMETSP1385-20130828/6489_1 /ASSEMBLY_ACC=CAM_ASM_000861 /TAXON_ID=933848 /ORGANISM="Elphidium margaritaceum" /LENGTH=933 /DNA_ID=CAMNT_0049347417 /DNA_START=26 /DNA_END=2827 /DNA_ORIENTATION=+